TKLPRVFLQKAPCARHVRFSRVQIPDRKTEGIPAVEPCMRDEDLAGRIDRFKNSLVQAVGVFTFLRTGPKTDDAERDWREALEVRTLVHPRREQLRETHVLRQPIAQPVSAKVTQHHPQLECSKSAA